MSELLPTIFAGFAKRRYKGKRRLIVAGEAGEGLTEYLPRTTLDALLKAEREKALREAQSMVTMRIVQAAGGGENLLSPSDIWQGIEALISEDATDG